VARAKRTERAEARRRHRAAFADQPAGGDLEANDVDDAPGATPPSRGPATPRSRPASSAGASAVQRPGIATAFRSSFRPLDVRGDLQALPRLVRHWSFYVPVVLSGVAVVLYQYFPRESLAYAFFGYFAGITPFGAVLLAGFFAPRASWLVGALVGVLAAVFLTLSVNVQIGGLPDGSFFQVYFPLPATPDAPVLISATDAKAQISTLMFEALTSGTIFSALFASAAAWYRRFLQRASPNRARPTTPTSRRPDGKIPRKQAQRPMLARRR
jgi:hypothetical protein